MSNEVFIDQLGLSSVSASADQTSTGSVAGVEDAVVVDGIFSALECESIVAYLDGTSSWKPANSNKSLRDCDRQVLVSPSLADLIISRCNLSVNMPEKIQMRKVTKQSAGTSAGAGAAEVGTEGVWRMSRVNEVFRAASYLPGGHFAPHRDGMIIPREGERSFFTLIIYLTETGFEGGETAFVQDSDGFALQRGEYDPAKHVTAKVAPQLGRCLIFAQNILHAGLPVLHGEEEAGVGGRKIILVSELFFERVEEPSKEECWDPEAVALFREAQELEEAGEFQKSIRAYSSLRFLDPEFAAFVGVP